VLFEMGAAVLPDPRAERHQRLAAPGLCAPGGGCLLPSTPQLDRAWCAWQAGRYQRGEISQRPGYADNAFRPR